jgi:hypothetical protein
MGRHQSKIVILASLAISLVAVFFVFRSKTQQSNTFSTPPPVPVVRAAEPIIVGSPDGKMSLTMRKEKGNGTVIYTFLIKDEGSGVQKEIFTKTEAAEVTLSIPDNTFSPNNKYVFLKDTGASGTTYFVLADTQVLDVSSLFAAKYQNYVITDATGWGGPTLLVINTNKAGGGTGPSFWFDVAGKSFIQLSTRFN